MPESTEQITEEELERRQAWSMCAGTVSGFRGAIGLANKRAANAFMLGHDEMAREFRDFAKQLKTAMEPEEKRLNEFIAENMKGAR